MKKIYFETLGCSKNQVDSEKMAYILSENGYDIVDELHDADIIIINTCSFIQSAKEEAINVIFDIVSLKKEYKDKKIVVAGCLAERYKDDLDKEFSKDEVDLIFGVKDISMILDAIRNIENIENRIFNVETQQNDDKILKRKILNYPGFAYLKISEGCSNRCSYCAIPIIRGNLKSRSIENILEEVDFLLTQDIKEIIVISQDTTNYGIDLYENRTLIKLLKKIDDKIGDKNIWIRVLYMHPDHIDTDLLIELSKIKSFIPYFDIPFQSASEKILKLMGRKGNYNIYSELINQIRTYFKKSVIRSSFIVGFPQETEEDFQLTLDFIKNNHLDWVGCFTYSKEDGTVAYNYQDEVDEVISRKRLDRLLDVSEIELENNLNKFIDIETNVLIEEKVDEDLFLGRIWSQAPEVDGVTVVKTESAKIGDFMNVRIIKINGKDLLAVE